MKKTALALVIGLIAYGCEKAPKKAAVPITPPNQAEMAEQMRAHGPDKPSISELKKAIAESKNKEQKPEGEADPAVEPATTEEKPATTEEIKE
jgi:PBP1b-binding outer membrane lipoprotein LpoB